MPRLPARWILNIGLWTMIAFLQSYQSYTSILAEGAKSDFTQVLLLQLSTWLPWAILTPALFSLSRRYPLERMSSTRSLVLYPAVALACVAVQVLSHTLGMIVFPSGSPRAASFFTMYGQMLRWLSFPGLIVFCGIVGAGHALNYSKKYRDRERRMAQLEQQLIEAQLRTLQSQLQPHFFFNTLHAIASLVRDRQHDAAVGMIAHLSELLRYTLDQADTQMVPLRQELDFIHRYLHIEKTRFSDRLNVNVHVDDEALDALVPTLLIQPLVENAIKHGISRLSGPGTLEIEARLAGSQLYISISNDGVGLDQSSTSLTSRGLGLRNARERLHQLYGEQHQFDLKEHGNGRVSASLSLPYQSLVLQTS
jgi:two-component system, LytTR family, sensor kinase